MTALAGILTLLVSFGVPLSYLPDTFLLAPLLTQLIDLLLMLALVVVAAFGWVLPTPGLLIFAWAAPILGALGFAQRVLTAWVVARDLQLHGAAAIVPAIVDGLVPVALGLLAGSAALLLASRQTRASVAA